MNRKNNANIKMGASSLDRQKEAILGKSFLVPPDLSSYNETPMRRRFITDWKFQTAYSLAVARGLIIGLLIPGLTLLFTLYLMSQQLFISPQQKTILVNGLNQLTTLFIIMCSVLSGVFCLGAFFISQRFIGPIQRMESWSVQHLMRQNPGALRVREKDEFHAVAQTLNKVVMEKTEVETMS